MATVLFACRPDLQFHFLKDTLDNVVLDTLLKITVG